MCEPIKSGIHNRQFRSAPKNPGTTGREFYARVDVDGRREADFFMAEYDIGALGISPRRSLA